MTNRRNGSRQSGFRMNLNMTKVMIYLVVLLAGLPAFGMLLFQDEYADAARKRESQKAANRQARHDAFVLPIADAAGKAGGVLISVGALILLVGGAGLVAAVVYQQRQRARVEAINQDVIELPNGALVDRRTLTTYAVEQGGNVNVGLLPDRNLQTLALMGETRVRSIEAMGGAESPILRYAAPNKLLAGAYDRVPNTPQYQVDEPETLQLPDNSLSRITAIEAVYNSDEQQWIVGQDMQTYNCFAHEPKRNPHIALHGGTNKGKTAGLAFAFIAHARNSDYYVIVLDGKAGLDFAETPDLKELYEWHDLTPELLLSYVEQLTAIMDDRYNLLRSNGVSNFEKLHAKSPQSRTEAPNILVVWEELGVAVERLKQIPKGDHAVKPYDAFESMFSNLLRLCRAVGIHMLMIDQDRDKWSASMKTNAGATFTFALGGYQSQSVAPGAPADIPQYHFWNDDDGQTYQAWDWTNEISLADELGPQENRNLIQGGEGYPMFQGFTPPPSNHELQSSQGENEFQTGYMSYGNSAVTCGNPSVTLGNSTVTHGNPAVTHADSTLDWSEIRSMEPAKRREYLKSISLQLELPIDTKAKQRAVYDAYLNLGKSSTDTCFYVLGSKGRNYRDLVDAIEAYERGSNE